MRRFFTSLLLAGPAILLLACDPAYPLFVRNGLGAPVLTRVTYETGVSNDLTLAPGERLAFLHPKGEIVDVVVLKDGQAIFHLDRNALWNMRSSGRDMRQITWNIQSNGIIPLTKPELDRLRSPTNK